MKEDERRKKQQKLWARERGEDTDSDDDDDEEDDGEVVYDTEHGDLESKDLLTGARSLLYGLGPFPFHGGESMSVRPAEMGRTIGPPSEPAVRADPPPCPRC